MNLVLHLVRRDAKLWGWTIALWAALGVCAMVIEISDPPEVSPYFPLKAFALTAQALLACALLSWIIQEDSATDPLAFWRSRPIAPGVLLTSKLVLLGALFVVTPLAAFSVVELLSPGKVGGSDTFFKMAVFLPAAVLAGSAVAACTKNLGVYLLIGYVCLFAENSLTTWLRDYADVPRKVVWSLAESRTVVSAIVVSAMSIMALLIQYHRRRAIHAFGIIALTVVCSALIRTLWMWRIV